MSEPIKLSIGATSKRVDIANVVALTFFNHVDLPRQSQLDVAMGWRDSELGGTGPALLVDKKNTISASATRSVSRRWPISAAAFTRKKSRCAPSACFRPGIG